MDTAVSAARHGKALDTCCTTTGDGKAGHMDSSKAQKSQIPHKAKPPRGWFSAWRRSGRAAQTDFADHGTAFGLDLSLHQAQLDAALPPVPPAPQPAPPAGWVRRLSRRRAG